MPPGHSLRCGFIDYLVQRLVVILIASRNDDQYTRRVGLSGCQLLPITDPFII